MEWIDSWADVALFAVPAAFLIMAFVVVVVILVVG